MMKKRTKKGEPAQWIRANVSYAGEGCLTWPFATNNGYSCHILMDGRKDYAHRHMCRLVNGEAPSSDHEASHFCGRGHLACVDPRHLSWKTGTENQLDRAIHGTKNLWSCRGKITDRQAGQIRALSGVKPQREIAALFGISRSTVSGIIRGALHKPIKVRPGKGYSYNKADGRWVARIGVYSGSIYLGRYKTEDEARAIFRIADVMVRAGLPVHRGMFNVNRREAKR